MLLYVLLILYSHSLSFYLLGCDDLLLKKESKLLGADTSVIDNLQDNIDNPDMDVSFPLIEEADVLGLY